jgi:hypothetical protein
MPAITAEQAHLPQERDRLAQGQEPLIRRPEGFDHLDFALKQDVEVPAILPLFEKESALGKLLSAEGIGQKSDFTSRERGEEGDAGDDLFLHADIEPDDAYPLGFITRLTATISP